jgi:DNA-directed RNA polymerase specialized sigma24 family protein
LGTQSRTGFDRDRHRFTPSSAVVATAPQDAQDLTQDFFVHLLEKGTLDRADQQRGRFRSFLLGALDHFLAHAAERARAGKRGGCQHVFLDDNAAENSYRLAAPEGMALEKAFDARWAATLVEVAFARLCGELQSEARDTYSKRFKASCSGQKTLLISKWPMR